jgi:hypothetical protein
MSAYVKEFTVSANVISTLNEENADRLIYSKCPDALKPGFFLRLKRVFGRPVVKPSNRVSDLSL